MSWTILLDMDGVVANFVKGVCGIYGVEYADVIANYPVGEWDITKVSQFNKPIYWLYRELERVGSCFWERLEEFDESQDILSLVKRMSDSWMFSTSPTRDPECAAGKIRWMRKFTGKKRFRNYMIGHRKELMAHPNTILVDDRDKNVDTFRACGGQAVLVPRIWNRLYRFDGSVADYVEQAIKAIQKTGI